MVPVLDNSGTAGDGFSCGDKVLTSPIVWDIS